LIHERLALSYLPGCAEVGALAAWWRLPLDDGSPSVTSAFFRSRPDSTPATTTTAITTASANGSPIANPRKRGSGVGLSVGGIYTPATAIQQSRWLRHARDIFVIHNGMSQ